jgi:hypothetical protein
VLVDGRLCLFVDGGGARVLSFCDETTAAGASQLDRALRSLVKAVRRMGLKRLQIEEIDGEKARSSPLADAFCRAGFRAGYRGIELDRRQLHDLEDEGEEEGNSER